MRASDSRQLGLTVTELVIAAVVLAILVSLAILMTLRASEELAYYSEVAEGHRQAELTMAEVHRFMRHADRATLVVNDLGVPPPPDDPKAEKGAELEVVFDKVLIVPETGEVVREGPYRLGFEYSPGDGNDGIDNDSNGLVDEGQLYQERPEGGRTVIVGDVLEGSFQVVPPQGGESFIIVRFQTGHRYLPGKRTVNKPGEPVPDGFEVVKVSEHIKLRNNLEE